MSGFCGSEDQWVFRVVVAVLHDVDGAGEGAERGQWRRKAEEERRMGWRRIRRRGGE